MGVRVVVAVSDDTVHLKFADEAGGIRRSSLVNVWSYRSLDSKWWQHLFMLGQSQHLIHHMYPGVPWYKYDPIWRAAKAKIPTEILRPSSYFARNHNH